MKTKERYQQCLDVAYAHAPFHLTDVIDLKHSQDPQILHFCQVCHNTRLRYLCKCTDKHGTTWYIGRDCHTKLEERYEEEKLHK